MVHIAQLILPFAIAATFLIIGILGLLLFERRVNYSRSIVLMLGSYGLVVSEVFIILYSMAHIHSWYKFHFHIPSIGDHDYFSRSNPIDIPSILILALLFTLTIFFLALIFSQISLRIMSRKLLENSNSETSDGLKANYSWLSKDYQLIVVNDNQLDAFTFTLLRLEGRRLKAENWIIITSGLIEILTEEEIEMVLAHEFSHTFEHDTRYAHLIYTIATIVFFDPMLKLFKYLIHEKHEYNADLHAVNLIEKPRTLASALFKMLKTQINITKRSISTGIISSKKPLIVRRIEKLLDYAELNKLEK
ncbi:MAG: M48 family metalloprotease [Candidatus Heimdallarchaeota archaeon]|nr:M48 family metalloprotease [Candidatus Heimdallarchaeota archaeon]